MFGSCLRAACAHTCCDTGWFKSSSLCCVLHIIPCSSLFWFLPVNVSVHEWWNHSTCITASYESCWLWVVIGLCGLSWCFCLTWRVCYCFWMLASCGLRRCSRWVCLSLPPLSLLTKTHRLSGKQKRLPCPDSAVWYELTLPREWGTALTYNSNTFLCPAGELQSCLYSHVPKPAPAVCPFDSEPVDGAIQNVHVSHSDFLCMFVFPSGRDRAEDSTEWVWPAGRDHQTSAGGYQQHSCTLTHPLCLSVFPPAAPQQKKWGFTKVKRINLSSFTYPLVVPNLSKHSLKYVILCSAGFIQV